MDSPSSHTDKTDFPLKVRLQGYWLANPLLSTIRPHALFKARKPMLQDSEVNPSVPQECR